MVEFGVIFVGLSYQSLRGFASDIENFERQRLKEAPPEERNLWRTVKSQFIPDFLKNTCHGVKGWLSDSLSCPFSATYAPDGEELIFSCRSSRGCIMALVRCVRHYHCTLVVYLFEFLTLWIVVLDKNWLFET